MKELIDKPYCRVAGLFNYYFSFAGCYHAVTNRILKLKDKRPHNHIIKFLLKRDFISFEPTNLLEVKAWSDASLFAIAAVFKNITIARLASSPTIAINELKAALLAGDIFLKFHNKHKHYLNLFVDNLNVLFLFRNGSCKWDIPYLFSSELSSSLTFSIS